MNSLPGISQPYDPLESGNPLAKKSKTDQETPKKSAQDIQSEKAVNIYNVAVTILGINRRRPSILAQLPRDVCRLIVKMTFPGHLMPIGDYITDNEFLELISKTRLITSVDLLRCRNLSIKSVIGLSKFKLTSLCLPYLDVPSFEAVVTLIQKLPNLKKYMGHANNEVLIALANHCPDLIHLEVSGRIEDSITDDVFKIVAPKFFKIQSIALSNLARITDKTLNELADHCHNLESVAVVYSKRMRNGDAKTLIEKCNRLKLLEFTDIFDDSTLYAANKNLGGITHLSLSQSFNSEEALIAFAITHPQLTHLKLDTALFVSEKTLLSFATHCPKLVEVVFKGTRTTEESFTALIHNCPQLKRCVTQYTDFNKPFLKEKYPHIKFE